MSTAPSERIAWRRDMARNASSAKGRVIMSLYRLGRSLPRPLHRLYRPLYYVVVDMVLGVSLPLETAIGPGLLIRHGQGLVVSWRSTMGADCEVHQHVTLGETHEGAVPHLGDRVRIGANAVVVGAVRIGDDATVGAGSVVVHDVPAGATVVGNPARVVRAAGTDE